MNRVEHILHAFSLEQIKFLIESIKCKEKTLPHLLTEEEYALELLQKALDK